MGHAHRAGDPPRGTRAGAIWALIALAALVLFVGTLTIWVERQVLDTDNWVNTSGQLLEDDAVRELAADALVEAVFADGAAEQQIAEALPEQLAPLAPQAAALAQNAAGEAADRLLALPQTQTLWEEANRVAHERLVAILREEDSGALESSDGTVTLDLAPLAERLGDRIGVQVEIPEGAAEVTIVESDDIDAAQTAVRILDVLSAFVLIAVIALLAVAVWLAAGRRREVLRRIGWTWVGVGILLLIIQRVGGGALIESITNAQTVDAGEAVWDIGTSLLRDISWAIVAYGLVAVLAAWVAGPSRWAIALRGLVAPTLRARPAIAYAAVAMVFLLVVLFGPSAAAASIVGIVLLALLLALGVWALRQQIQREFPLPEETHERTE